MQEKQLNIAAVVTNDKKRSNCTIHMPSLGLMSIGQDYIEAYAIAISTITALYHYSREHNLDFKEEAPTGCMADACKGKNQFCTYITVEV